MLTILYRETEKSQQQQRDHSNAIIREDQPWQRKKQKKLLRKLQKNLQKKLLKRKRSSWFCKAVAFEGLMQIGPFFMSKINFVKSNIVKNRLQLQYSSPSQQTHFLIENFKLVLINTRQRLFILVKIC